MEIYSDWEELNLIYIDIGVDVCYRIVDEKLYRGMQGISNQDYSREK